MSPTAPSIAESVFKKLEAMDAPSRVGFLQKYCDDQQHETDWMDFKSGSYIKKVDDRWIDETWSKFLSAFSNSGGGILIWGVETKEDTKSKKDCAAILSPVPRPGELLTRLDKMQFTLANPPVPGVKFLDFVDPSASNGSGYLISFVPDSPFKPPC